ncbi:hypothetical protein B0H63DRAFT_522587 [Podospora didyma]|uniref:Splicing factor RBM39 linker domain-containing protein n=1 Tax=Podospora didyma TaxID=330526 RepID=A0AAE0NPN2_9PEZI|nr:hypothetical protein B0H63DRAFT_522587 [Podospora didyma]
MSQAAGDQDVTPVLMMLVLLLLLLLLPVLGPQRRRVELDLSEIFEYSLTRKALVQSALDDTNVAGVNFNNYSPDALMRKLAAWLGKRTSGRNFTHSRWVFTYPTTNRAMTAVTVAI